MMQFAAIAIGGAIGSMLRYGVQKSFSTSSPTGTLAVNIAGCFVIGILWAVLAKESHHHKRLLLMTGFCGGFTTFSAFTLDGVQLLLDGRWATVSLYLTASVVGGLLATYFGYKIFS